MAKGGKMTINENDALNAIKEGVQAAFVNTMQGCSDLPGQDIYFSIEKGVKEALLEWLDSNKEDIIESIGKSK
jgi:hypothetical protein